MHHDSPEHAGEEPVDGDGEQAVTSELALKARGLVLSTFLSDGEREGE